MRDLEYDMEPTLADLAAIELEEPLIRAETDLVDAEVGMLHAADRGGPTKLDRRRLRRANRRVLYVALTLAFGRRHELCRPFQEDEVGMSNCRWGCKVYRCAECGEEQLRHSAIYGCRTPLAA
ncbi:DUF6284 family protein [Actinoplanes sp. NPDC026619]|uniref:DUF6284 family protein n=1 Tax=Actinoplanes sp. NPDC026619 TaxID=3155798 RepID=UPI0033FAD3C8